MFFFTSSGESIVGSMASVEEFLKAPSEELLEGCSREQLVRIAEHYDLDVGDKRMKENIRNIVKANLIDRGVFVSQPRSVHPVAERADVSGGGEAGLTFEQKRELELKFGKS